MTEDTRYPERVQQFRNDCASDIKRINNRMNLFELAHQHTLLKNCGRITIVVGRDIDRVFQDLRIHRHIIVTELLKRVKSKEDDLIPNEYNNNALVFVSPENDLHHTDMKSFANELLEHRNKKRNELLQFHPVNDVLIFTHCYELIKFFVLADKHKIVRLIRVENYPDNPRFVEYPPNELLYTIESCGEVR